MSKLGIETIAPEPTLSESGEDAHLSIKESYAASQI